MSLASVAAQQSNAIAAANQAAAALSSPANAAASAASAHTAAQAGQTALSSLTSNFGDFLNLLMTQLQNQDPTSPMDPDQFTSELVQFTSVEQQITTNSALNQLISLNQAGELMQSTAMVGKQVLLSSKQLPLQNGSGALQFTAPAAEPVGIAIYNAAGQQIYDTSLDAAAGPNNWTWKGQNNNGGRMPDGAYTVAVEGANPDGSTAALPFSVGGTITGVNTGSSGALQLELGATTVPFSSVTQVLTQ